jgi:tetratricopeptide (TPR) repeat protein
MADNSSAREVDVQPFQPPKHTNQTTSPFQSKKLPYIGALVVAVFLVPILFKLFELLGPADDLIAVGTSETEVAALDLEVESQAAIPEESPFTDALLAQARLDAQAVLSVLLPLRTSLEDKGAQDWAYDQFLQLATLGAAGDELYQTRDFDTAVSTYKEALEIAQDIDSRTVSVAEAMRTEAFAALVSLNAVTALEKFTAAVLIEPDNQAGQNGIERANNIEEVLQLTSMAADHLQESALAEAKIRIEAALTLDPEHGPASDLLVQIEQSILLANFQQYMSEGYQALSGTDFGTAERAFNVALGLIPNNSAAADALDQLNSTREADRGAGLMQQAQSSANAEKWLEAQQAYQQLLEENPNRVEARVALVTVEARLNLDNQIEQIIANPLGLKEEQSWRQAEQTLGQAKAVRNGGPVLTNQIEQLADTIRKARTPVRLTISSDGHTQISVLGISDLGLIRNHPLDLNPGKYVVVGKKSGFQDVREEVVISGDEARMDLYLVPTRSLGTL